MVCAQGLNYLFPNVMHFLLPVLLVVLLIPDLAITAKRWHDRNKSSWWLLLNVPLVFGRMSLPTLDPATAAQPSLVQNVISLAALACGAWIFVECGLLKGDDSHNQYGGKPQ
jgi:uncharacterized membrane protein YhaH (DUF805 family)